MKLCIGMLTVALVGMGLALMASQVAAEGTSATPKQLLDEANKLYAAHNYDGALKRLQQVDRAGLGLFEKGGYDSLLERTQKAITGKAADEKALAEGKEARAQMHYTAAIEKLSRAASSEYLDDTSSGAAKGLLEVAKKEHEKAVADAKGVLAQAATVLKDGKTDEARKLVASVKAMDIDLGYWGRSDLAGLEKKIKVTEEGKVAAVKAASEKAAAEKAKAEKEAAAKAESEKLAAAKAKADKEAADKAAAAKAEAVRLAAADKAAAEKAKAEKEAAAKAESEKLAAAKAKADKEAADKAAAAKAESEKLAAAKAKADKEAADKTAVSKKAFEEARQQYAARDFDAAQKSLQKVDRAQLGFFEKVNYDALVKDTPNAIEARSAAEKVLADGKDALAKKQYPVAVERLSKASSSDYLAADKVQAAKAALQIARQEHDKTVAEAKSMMAQASAALDAGQPADARKLVDAVKAMDVDLGWWARLDLSKLDKKVKSAEAGAMAIAAKPAPKPVEVVKGPEKPPATGSAVVPVEVKPVEKPPVPAPVEVKPVETPPAPPEAKLSLAQQVKRAEAEDEMKLGDDALEHREFEKARVHFARAMQLWPDSIKARQGLDRAMKLLAEREEPLMEIVSDVRALERQRIIASVQEMMSQAERGMGRAERPEDYLEALRPLAQADRTIDVSSVLSAEEQERLREEVYVLRKEINVRRAEAERIRAEKGLTETVAREKQRRADDRRDRENKVRQLWERATELRKSMQFGEAVQVLDTLLLVDPNDERATRWKEDLLYLEAQDRQVRVRTERESQVVESLTDVEELAIQPGEKVRGKTTYLRYADAKDWKALRQFRREFTKAVTAEPKAVAETRRRLLEEIDLDFEKTSLDNVLKYISEVQRGLNIVVDPDVATKGIDLATRVVDLKVKRVSVESVLGLIMGDDIGYRVESGYILVTTKEKLQQNLPAVTYPVQDLVAQIPDFGGQAPRFEVGDIAKSAASAAGGGGASTLFTAAATTTEAPIGSKDIIDLIQRTVSSQSDPSVAAWSEEGGPAAIQYLNGLLIITQTRKGQEKVADILEQLRRERAIMISIEARFCDVTDEFLQDITLDVDAAFINTGNSRFLPPPGTVIQNPGKAAAGGVGTSTYDTLPGTPALAPYAGGPVAQPIIVSSTGSNGMGTSTLLPLGGTAFANFTANEGGMVVSGTFLDDIQVGFLLRAIQADVRSTTLQSPRITLYNGQRSYITVANVVTYIADLTPLVGDRSVAWDPTIAGIPVGVTLDVRATVSADRCYVQMDLRPQVATLGTPPFRQVFISAAVPGAGIATAPIDLPNVFIQDFKTTVSVPDSGTLLLGGTRTFNESEAETGVPILDKLPILKRLFNNRATVRRSRNLLILIRPKILIQAEEENKLGYDNF